MKKVAVIGIGNILLGDDGVGVRVVEELRKRKLPENVKIYDGATSGLRIINFLVDVDKGIIVDAVRGGKSPGNIYRFPIEEALNKPSIISLHDIDFVFAYKVSRDVLGLTRDITIIGIEPERIERGLELSEKVKKAVPEAVKLILKELSLPDQ